MLQRLYMQTMELVMNLFTRGYIRSKKLNQIGAEGLLAGESLECWVVNE